MKLWVVTIDYNYDTHMVGGVYSNKALAGRAVMKMIYDNTITLEAYHECVTDMWDDGVAFIIETMTQNYETTWYNIEPVTLNA